MNRSLPLALLAAAAIAAQASAQTSDFAQRQSDLRMLAGLFGELHHIRRLCEPRYEADVWRERMKQLIDLEQPAGRLREELVSAFNDGYRQAQSRFAACDRSASDYAAARAEDGEAVVARLAAPLREMEAEAAARPFIWSTTSGDR